MRKELGRGGSTMKKKVKGSVGIQGFAYSVFFEKWSPYRKVELTLLIKEGMSIDCQNIQLLIKLIPYNI